MTPYCCCFKYKNQNYSHYGLKCVSKALNAIFNITNNKDIFFSHNLTFDGLMILNNLPNDVQINKKYTSFRRGSIYSLSLKRGNAFIIFRCSLKILPLSLDKISKFFEITSKHFFDHSIVNEQCLENTDFKKNAILYCVNDVEIVVKFMNILNKSIGYNFGNWYIYCQSISGIAIKLFKSNYNEYNIKWLDIDIDEKIRPAYYGGRCEVFGNSYDHEQVFHYDFTGMYTNRLLEEYPIDNPFFNENPLKIENPGFYSVQIKSHNFSIPILPYRDLQSNKLLFPNGRFAGVYWYEELLLFLENGGIVEKIFWSFEYKEMAKPFKSFAEHCINERKKSKINNTIWKLIPNSLIGRLGLKNDYEKTEIIDETVYDPRKYQIICDKKFNNQYLIRYKTLDIDLHPMGNVAYAAITTAKARILWWKSAQIINNSGGRILYCDTDSIFAAFNRNVLGETHGEIVWNNDKNDCLIKKSCFATSKAYAIIYDNNVQTIKIKGINTKESNAVSFNDFEKFFYNNQNNFLKTQLFQKNNYKITIKNIIKKINLSNYNKREFIKNKKESTPLTIVTLDE